MDLKLFGRNIKHFRQLKNLTQEQLAEKTQLSVNYIGYIERGIKNPTTKTLISLANALGVSADILLSDYIDAAIFAKTTELSVKLEQLPASKQREICDIIDILIEKLGNNE